MTDADKVRADVDRIDGQPDYGGSADADIVCLMGHCRALLAENARLRAALKPFAELGHGCIETGYKPGAKFTAILHADDCRRAADLLATRSAT